MSEKSKTFVLGVMQNLGKAEASALREKAAEGTLTDAEIIAAMCCVPDWNPNGDYTSTPVGMPALADGCAYRLLKQHNASEYPDAAPGDLTELWRVVEGG